MDTNFSCSVAMSGYAKRKTAAAFNINVEALLWLPEWHIYWKDLGGHFMGCNDLMAESISLTSRHAILQKTDYDLPIRKEDADSYRHNDLDVIQKATPVEVQEFAIKNQVDTTYLSLKTPLYVQHGAIEGVLGMTRILHQQQASGDEQLTARQEECLYYFICGLTAKQIAQQLNVAVKTVENHLTNIKAKLHCSRRDELVKKAFRLTGIQRRLAMFNAS